MEQRICIEAKGLCKSFPLGKRREINVLNNIDLQVMKGTMTAIFGPSGCGKSTLLHCLAGLEPISSGTVHLLGRDISHLNAKQLAIMRRTDIGFVFQNYNLIPSMNVERNILLPLILSHRDIDRKRLLDVMGKLSLSGREKDDIGSLSGGERQRVALARVLMEEPSVIFADEPTGALDHKAGATVINELRTIADDSNRAVLIVTHNAEIRETCDRSIQLRDGHIADIADE